jgi:hypothetical protein
MWVWLTVFSGFVVKFEPAPYDLLMIAICSVFVALGLVRLPAGASTPMLLLGLFVVSNLIACFSSFDYTRSIYYMAVTFYLVLSLVFVMCLIYEDFERVTNVIWSAYLVSGVVAANMAVLGYFHLVPGLEVVLAKGAGRAYGLFKDPNVMSPFLVPPTIYLFSKFELGSGRRTVFVVAFMLVTIVGILLSFSRAAAGNLVVSFLVYLFLRLVTAERGSSLAKLLWSATVILVIGGAVVSWVVLNTQAAKTFAFKGQLLVAHDQLRFEAQERGLETIISWPFGIGPGLAKEALGVNLPTHSVYIQMMLEDGWLGGLAFMVLLGLTLFRSFALVYSGLRDPRFFVALASLLGLLLNSFVIDSTHWRHLWLLLGILWGQLLVAGYRQKAQAQPGYAAFRAQRQRRVRSPAQ